MTSFEHRSVPTPTAEAPLPAGWKEYKTKGGRPYFLMPDGKTTTWNRPQQPRNSSYSQSTATSEAEAAAAARKRRIGRHLHVTVTAVWGYLRSEYHTFRELEQQQSVAAWRADSDLKLQYMFRVVQHRLVMLIDRWGNALQEELLADLDTLTKEELQDVAAKAAYCRWCGWVEHIAERLGIELVELDRSSSFSQGYCERVGDAFEKEAARGNVFAARADVQRDILLFWLGIYILEESLEKFERLVLSTYRAVCADDMTKEGNFNDEIRASMLTFTTAESVRDWCTDAPLFGFVSEVALFREHLQHPKPMFTASAAQIASLPAASLGPSLAAGLRHARAERNGADKVPESTPPTPPSPKVVQGSERSQRSVLSTWMAKKQNAEMGDQPRATCGSASSEAMKNRINTESSSSKKSAICKPVALLNVVFNHFNDCPCKLEHVVSALVHAIDAGNQEAVKALLAKCESGNVESRESVAQISKSKNELNKSLNTYRLMTLRDRFLLSNTEKMMAVSLSSAFEELFMEGTVWMTPMLAATSRPARDEKTTCRPFAVACSASRDEKTWAAQVIRRLYDLGADFKAFRMQQSSPSLDALIQTYGMHVMITRDPLYQLVKYQIRDVKQRDVEERRDLLRAKQAAFSQLRSCEGATVSATASAASTASDISRASDASTSAFDAVPASAGQSSARRNVELSANSSDQRITEEIVAENFKTWKRFLDEVLDPGNGKIRRDQTTFAVAALANSARVTALPVLLELVDAARLDINFPLPAADRQNRQNRGPLTQQIVDFFRSNYAGLLSLLKRGALMPRSAQNLPEAAVLGEIEKVIANDRQNTHLSQVNLVLKQHVKLAKSLVASVTPEAMLCLTSELADISTDTTGVDSRRLLVDDLQVSPNYLLKAIDEMSDAAVLRVGLDVPRVREMLLDRLDREVLATAEASSEVRRRTPFWLDRTGNVPPLSWQGYCVMAKDFLPVFSRYDVAPSNAFADDVASGLMKEVSGHRTVSAVERQVVTQLADPDGCELVRRFDLMAAVGTWYMGTCATACSKMVSAEEGATVGLPSSGSLPKRTKQQKKRFAEQLEQLQRALGTIRASLRTSVKRFFTHLTHAKVLGAAVDTGAAVLDLVYKALVCAFAKQKSGLFDVLEDVLEPLFQALLKAENEYGLGARSCAPGSISFVLAVLEGRLDLDAGANLAQARLARRLEQSAQASADGIPKPSAGLPGYRKALEDALLDPTPQGLEALRLEAVRRCGGAGAALEEILSIITAEPDAFDYARNELRGVFFSQLVVEFDGTLSDTFYGEMDRRRSRSHRPSDVLEYVEPEYISDDMSALLDDLARVADVFARSFLLVVEEIPRVFAMALEA